MNLVYFSPGNRPYDKMLEYMTSIKQNILRNSSLENKWQQTGVAISLYVLCK